MVCIDLEVLTKVGNEYLVLISKVELHSLVTDVEKLTVRHCGGKKPTVLEPYGDSAVRTQEDASDSNNLENLPKISLEGLKNFIAVVGT